MFVPYNEYGSTMKEHNNQHINTVCPECKNHNILYDNEREETYCTKCGLILQDNTIFSIIKYLETQRYQEMFIRGLWKKKPRK